MFKFKLVEREDPAHRGSGGKLYAAPIYQGIMSMSDVARWNQKYKIQSCKIRVSIFLSAGSKKAV